MLKPAKQEVGCLNTVRVYCKFLQLNNSKYYCNAVKWAIT